MMFTVRVAETCGSNLQLLHYSCAITDYILLSPVAILHSVVNSRASNLSRVIAFQCRQYSQLHTARNVRRDRLIKTAKLQFKNGHSNTKPLSIFKGAGGGAVRYGSLKNCQMTYFFCPPSVL